MGNAILEQLKQQYARRLAEKERQEAEERERARQQLWRQAVEFFGEELLQALNAHLEDEYIALQYRGRQATLSKNYYNWKLTWDGVKTRQLAAPDDLAVWLTEVDADIAAEEQRRREVLEMLRARLAQCNAWWDLDALHKQAQRDGLDAELAEDFAQARARLRQRDREEALQKIQAVLGLATDEVFAEDLETAKVIVQRARNILEHIDGTDIAKDLEQELAQARAKVESLEQELKQRQEAERRREKQLRQALLEEARRRFYPFKYYDIVYGIRDE